MPGTSKESCFEDLKRRILATELEPGAALDEVSLSEHYGLSRTPLREVLQRLSGAGCIEIEANRGAKVASMNLSTMRVFFQTAPMIYANIARLAAENRKPSQIGALQQEQSNFRAALNENDPQSAALCNHRFHAIIGDMSHNPYLLACLDRLLIDHTRLSQTFYRPIAPTDLKLVETAAAQHDQMIDAIDAHDVQRVTDLTLEHWDLSRDQMERFVRPDPLPVDLLTQKDTAHGI